MSIFNKRTVSIIAASSASILCVILLGACDGGDTRTKSKPVELTFVGVSTILISDGETQLLSDGFFTRPAIVSLGAIQPDITEIDAQLELLDIDKLATVMVLHSHYDHAMDAPYVSAATDAVLMGSSSTANIARGWGLHDAQILEVETDRAYQYGDFEVTFIASRHYAGIPSDPNDVTIDDPLIPPANFLDYKEGITYSVHIDHPSTSILIHASVNYEPGALSAYDADLVLLGVSGLGASDDDFQSNYYREVVESVGATKIIPIHWDNFFIPLTNPLEPLEGFDESLDFLNQQAADDGNTEVILLDYSESRIFQ